MRLLRFLPAFALLIAGLACQPSQHAVLLTVHSEDDIAYVRVTVMSLERVQRHEQPLFRVDRTAEQIAEEPIHVVVTLPTAEHVLVHIAATRPDGERLYATRCYSPHGIVEDSVLLYGPLGALDPDGDGFVVNPSDICRGLDENGRPRPCNDDDDYLCPDERARDCREGDPTIHPGARTICQDGIDQDCDGMDEPCGDHDGDGFPACAAGQTVDCDCDDTNPSIHPGAFDICNDGIDQDCDGADACCDLDGDGYPQCANGLPDCNDQDPNIHPGAQEICDGVDNDCNGLIDELEECRDPDQDGDGYPACGREEPGQPCDCDDCDPTVYPGAREICGNGKSESCMPDMPDAGCPEIDMDGDGVPPPFDCDDNDPLIFPPHDGREPIERCGDGRASNCIPSDADRGCPELDFDGDGFVEPPGCEHNPNINPDVPETCNGIDDDCDGFIDEGLFNAEGARCVAGEWIHFDNHFNNCGGCRVTCARPEGEPQIANACVDGVCTCNGGNTCELHETCCFGTGCFDLQNDDQNCGACGRACGAGETCVDGRCTCGSITAAPGQHACPDSDPAMDVNVCCSGECHVILNSDAHCGQCDNPCITGDRCEDRMCRSVCGNGTVTQMEECDDGNLMGGDGCSSDCRIEPGWECPVPNAPCTPIMCGTNQRVQDYECVNCPPGSTNAPEQATAGHTTCDCGTDRHVQGNNCAACPSLSRSSTVDPIPGDDTYCDCPAGHYVQNNACNACPQNSTRAESDRIPGNNTTCDCPAGHYVQSGACNACPSGTTRPHVDPVPGNNTTCDCPAGHYVQGNTCIECPKGTRRNQVDPIPGGNTSCVPITCGVNERVQDNACVACPAGSTNEAGDDASGPDTYCDCPPGHYVDGNVCRECPAGTKNDNIDRIPWMNTSCVPITCAANYRVENHMCIPCPPNSTNPEGDNASGQDTVCECIENHHVAGNQCVSCESGKTRPAGDLVPGPNTMCDPILCAEDYRLAGNMCVPCPANSTSPPNTSDASCTCPPGFHVEGGECRKCPDGSTNTDNDPIPGMSTGCVPCGDDCNGGD